MNQRPRLIEESEVYLRLHKEYQDKINCERHEWIKEKNRLNYQLNRKVEIKWWASFILVYLASFAAFFTVYLLATHGIV